MNLIEYIIANNYQTSSFWGNCEYQFLYSGTTPKINNGRIIYLKNIIGNYDDYKKMNWLMEVANNLGDFKSNYIFILSNSIDTEAFIPNKPYIPGKRTAIYKYEVKLQTYNFTFNRYRIPVSLI